MDTSYHEHGVTFYGESNAKIGFAINALVFVKCEFCASGPPSKSSAAALKARHFALHVVESMHANALRRNTFCVSPTDHWVAAGAPPLRPFVSGKGLVGTPLDSEPFILQPLFSVEGSFVLI